MAGLRTKEGDATRRRVLEAIRANPGVSMRDLAATTDLSLAGAWSQVQMLMRDGVLDNVRCPTCGKGMWEINDDNVREVGDGGVR